MEEKYLLIPYNKVTNYIRAVRSGVVAGAVCVRPGPPTAPPAALLSASSGIERRDIGNWTIFLQTHIRKDGLGNSELSL